MLEKIAKWLTRKPKLVAMMAVLMLIPAAIGYISTRINYDILSYLPEDLESVWICRNLWKSTPFPGSSAPRRAMWAMTRQAS